jgi:hypothetical protein
MENDKEGSSLDTQSMSRGQAEDSPDTGRGSADVEDAATLEANQRWSRGQDGIPTPVPLEVPTQERRSRFSSCALWGVVVVSLVIGLASLALNAVLIVNLMSARQAAIEGLDAALAALGSFEGQGFHYEYHFDETIPFSGDIPIQQDLVFPFQGEIPINTTVQVPIDAGILGSFTVNVPINTTFDVDLEVPVSVSQTIHVETEVPLDLVIPIDIEPDDPVIQNLIDQIQAWLLELRDTF